MLIKLVSNCNLPLLCEFTAGIYQTFFGWSVLMTLSFSNILIERLCNVYDLLSLLVSSLTVPRIIDDDSYKC